MPGRCGVSCRAVSDDADILSRLAQAAADLAAPGDGLWLADGGRVAVSSSLRHLLGEDGPDLVMPAAAWLERVHPDERSAAAELAAAGRPARWDLRLLTADHRPLWVHERIIRCHGAVVGIITDIEERRRKELLSDLASETLDVGLWQWDIAAQRMWWSPRLVAMLGYGHEEIPVDMDGFHGLIHPADRAAVVQVLDDYLARRSQQHRVEFRMRSCDGSWRMIRSQGACHLDAAGNPSLLVGTHVDVTDIHATNELLSDSERRHRALVELMPVGLIQLDATGACEFVNRRWTEITGLDLDGSLGSGWVQSLHDDDRAGVADAWMDAARGGGDFSHELRFIRPDGTVNWVALIAVPVRDDGGGVVGYLGAAVDLNARKTAEQQVVAQQALLRQFVERTPAAVAMLDRDLRYLLASRRWLKDYQLIGVEVEGRCHYDIFPEIGETWKANHQRCLAGESVRCDEDRFERADGTVQWLRWRIDPWRAADGAIGGIIMFTEDITAQKLLGDELRRAKDAAEQASRAKGDFLATMSHEIRTPINGIVGMAELLNGSRLDAEQRGYTETIGHSATALLTIINDILDFSKIEAGRLDLERIPLEPATVVEDAAVLFTEQAHGKGVELVCDIAATVPARILGDPGRLRQVVVNLLGNAVKFTQRGEIVISLSVDPDTTGGPLLVVQVRDTGIGIPPDTIPRLFTSFTQADSSTARRFGGTGLGLAISKRLVEAMGGAISVESAPGVGTTFTCRLPIDCPSAPTASTAIPVLPSGLLIAVIDDHQLARDAACRLLASGGVAPLPATSTSEVLAALRAGAPVRAVVLDLGLPDEDGLAAARILVQAGLAVVCLTAHAGHIALIRAAGITNHLPKPVRRARLFTALAEVLGVVRSKPKSVTPPPRRLRGRVLVAEDNVVNQRLVVAQLARLGLIATIASDGREAVQMLEREHFDIVLMDCQMPEMDGFAATALVRSREAGTGRRVPIIAVTANAMAGDREACLAAGMDDYLSKPIRMDDLMRTLAPHLPADPGPDGPAIAGVPPMTPAPVLVDPAVIARLRVELDDVDGTIMRELIDAFAEESLPLAVQVSEGTCGDLRRAAHKLKGSSLNLGCHLLAERTAAIERAAAGGDLATAQSMARGVDQLARDSIASLRRSV